MTFILYWRQSRFLTFNFRIVGLNSPTKLAPHLNRHSKDDALEHTRSHQLLVAGNGLLPFKAKRFLYFLVFGQRLGVIDISATMQIC
jgi:hypothetical protein